LRRSKERRGKKSRNFQKDLGEGKAGPRAPTRGGKKKIHYLSLPKTLCRRESVRKPRRSPKKKKKKEKRGSRPNSPRSYGKKRREKIRTRLSRMSEVRGSSLLSFVPKEGGTPEAKKKPHAHQRKRPRRKDQEKAACGMKRGKEHPDQI